MNKPAPPPPDHSSARTRYTCMRQGMGHSDMRPARYENAVSPAAPLPVLQARRCGPHLGPHHPVLGWCQQRPHMCTRAIYWCCAWWPTAHAQREELPLSTKRRQGVPWTASTPSTTPHAARRGQQSRRGRCWLLVHPDGRAGRCRIHFELRLPHPAARALGQPPAARTRTQVVVRGAAGWEPANAEHLICNSIHAPIKTHSFNRSPHARPSVVH